MGWKLFAGIERHVLCIIKKVFGTFDQTRSRDLLRRTIVDLGPFDLYSKRVWTHPQVMDLPSAQRHYSNEEKSQLIANLNIEGPLSVPLNLNVT